MPALLYTTMTIITWATYEDQMENLTFDEEREIKIQSMAAEGKTDTTAIIVSPTVTKRFFVDVAAAQEYIDFVLAGAAKYGLNIVSTEIQENAI